MCRNIKQQQYTLVKLPFRIIIENEYDLNLFPGQELDYLIQQGDSPLFNQIERLRGKFSVHIPEIILVTAKKNPREENLLKELLYNGFNYNGRHYSRFGKSASQSKLGITAFVSDDIFDELYMITEMDIHIGECVISKYESQRCLPFSSCTLINGYIPRIVIIGEYEKVLKDQYIRYVISRNKTIIDKSTGEEKSVIVREIEEGYHDIKLSPFDGCGCHEIEFAYRTSSALGLDYTAIGDQIRLPFIKGYSVYVPFRKILKTMGILQLKDIYGKWHSVDDIDCIWNVSMFKGHKIFKERYGDNAWDEYMNTLKKYHFCLGISKYSHHIKDLNLKSRMNFQYLQCLDLWNPKYIDSFYGDTKHEKYDILDEKNQGKIIKIATYTTELFEKIIKGDKFYTYKFMGVNDTGEYALESKYIEAVLINDIMLKDVAVKRFIHRKLKKYIEESKIGKIYADGFYHTVVGDMIGYLEFAAGLDPVGCLKAHEFFCDTLKKGKALSFRSPLVDPSEVNSVNLVSNEITDKWFSYFKDQDICMINMYDLSAPQQGGMDEDGDAVFLCNDPNIIENKIDKPIIIDIEDKLTAKTKPYTKENLVEYELATRDSRIGEITNCATSILNKYTTNEKIKKVYDDLVSLLRLYQGKEIDFLKTGVRWQMNAGLRKHLKQLPWFLLYNYPPKLAAYERLREKNKGVKDNADKVKLNAYRTPSPMNELCDYINTWEKKNIIWDNSVVDTRCLILNNALDLNDKALIKNIRHIINDFSREFKEVCQKKETNKENDFCVTDMIINKYKKTLSILSCNEELIANYVIKVSYANNSISKQLAWLGYGDYIIKNLKINSPKNKHVSIIETPYKTSNSYEYLGKYYLFQEGDNDL